MKALILASGKGERLKPLTDTLNKGMIEVGGKPILEHIVNSCISHGIRELVFAVGVKKEQVKDYFKDRFTYEGMTATIQYSESDDVQQTAGEIAKARQFLFDEEDFLVHYGDTLTNLNLKAFYRFHKASNAVVTLPGMEEIPTNSGIIMRVGTGIGFEEKPLIKKEGCWSNVPVYWVSSGVWQCPDVAYGKDLNFDVLPYFSARSKIALYTPRDLWHLDIGDHKKLKLAREAYENGTQLEVRKLG